MHSHPRIAGSPTALWDVPVNVLLRHLDGAAFAMEAVLGVNLELGILGLFVDDVLIHPCRAETFLGCSELLVADTCGQVGQLGFDLEVGGLVVLVVGTGTSKVGE